MKEVLLLKHAVGGRTFIHTGHQPLEYTVTPLGNGWRIKLNTTLTATIQELLKWKEELNVFLFQEFTDRPVKKIWFYVKDGPVYYDDQAGQLVIHTESRIEYIPSDFMGERSR